MFKFETIGKRSDVVFEHDAIKTGKCKLWMPEGISTERGSACIYPYGMQWRREGDRLFQEASEEHAFGPGNFEEVEPGVLKCNGIRVPKERPLPWQASYAFGDVRVDFSLTVRNPYKETLPRVASVVCFRFMEAPWWNDDVCFLKTAEGIKTITQLGRPAGLPNKFQAWLLEGEEDHPGWVFAREFWGFNPTRTVAPVWAVHCEPADVRVVVRCETAHYIHSNAGNPCNDLALKFGDLAPAATATCRGSIELTHRSVEEVLGDV